MVGNSKDNYAFPIRAKNNREWEFFEEHSLGVLCGWRTSSWECQSSGRRCFNLLGKCHA